MKWRRDWNEHVYLSLHINNDGHGYGGFAHPMLKPNDVSQVSARRCGWISAII